MNRTKQSLSKAFKNWRNGRSFPFQAPSVFAFMFLGFSTSTVFAFSNHSVFDRETVYHNKAKQSSKFVIATSAVKPEVAKLQTFSNSIELDRTYGTDVDLHFQKHKELPFPKIKHDSLDRLLQENKSIEKDATEKILVIGDVHGCLNELKALVKKASNEHNDGKEFCALILVGDLCNKGPFSAEVIQYVRNQKSWFSVRGNHDNAALMAALGDEKRREKEHYQWVKKLSDEDITWMSQLPYTIRIPKHRLNMNNPSLYDRDVIIVHAGLIPRVGLDQQDVKTMTTIREVTHESCNSNKDSKYFYYDKKIHSSNSKPWASVWNGEHVIFGHDAKRGIQQENYATGLDSGACYGKFLTGIILPGNTMISIEAERVHCPIN
ncbi:hypothetical protein CTEN210_00150 [Chaetoceros tenuissimus]|uniref:Calcineurin-like phosphoesterase domain-containing protein n=1 Tax=Chaetoceros tenuissimus TaxID=426638 RepID=A0AAD3CCT9_9STRA|nr:hypothetical protein CTEN210_00150 [Chaetoceros tenuissimus]